MALGFLDEGLTIWVLLGLASLAVIALAYTVLGKRNSFDLPVQRRSRLFSAAEKIFFERLVESLADDYFIFTKVSMLDVIEASPIATARESKSILKSLDNLYFDFILCNKHDLSIFGVVELENFDSEKRKSTQAFREKLITEVCNISHLRLFYFDVKQDYYGVDLRRLVTGKSSISSNKRFTSSDLGHSQFTVDKSSNAVYEKGQHCPQCNGEVVTKVAIKGKRIGEKFLMCRKYPYCDYREASSDRKVVRRLREQTALDEKRAHAKGYTDWSSG